ncbi:DUF2059 domain-containing protein [Anaeromyxobacter oryzae]|uniref:DUF2059 domain-containing protein n=1 Tax=Anaeromyxobacter oryzae TaxID=2918170 RepID=A0ABN6MQW3_9BACT|nr:DUF2059 domain-containing protein [Anaeromyxobacter oryzae]BDG02103.1 hypothetical protein AMOR_10990 [Anaeromyxobacter oryzae]
MKHLLAVLVPALLLASAPRARAADPAQPTPVAVELARYVLPEENWNRTLTGISQQTVQYLSQMAQQQGGSTQPELFEKLMKQIMSIYSYQEIVDLQASVLAKHYTEAELRELLAFYKTPIGQKTIRVMPDVAQDVNGQMMAVMQQRLPAVLEKLKPEFEKAAAEHQASGGATAAPASEKPARKK